MTRAEQIERALRDSIKQIDDVISDGVPVDWRQWKYDLEYALSLPAGGEALETDAPPYYTPEQLAAGNEADDAAATADWLNGTVSPRGLSAWHRQQANRAMDVVSRTSGTKEQEAAAHERFHEQAANVIDTLLSASPSQERGMIVEALRRVVEPLDDSQFGETLSDAFNDAFIVNYSGSAGFDALVKAIADAIEAGDHLKETP